MQIKRRQIAISSLLEICCQPGIATVTAAPSVPGQITTSKGVCRDGSQPLSPPNDSTPFECAPGKQLSTNSFQLTTFRSKSRPVRQVRQQLPLSSEHFERVGVLQRRSSIAVDKQHSMSQQQATIALSQSANRLSKARVMWQRVRVRAIYTRWQLNMLSEMICVAK